MGLLSLTCFFLRLAARANIRLARVLHQRLDSGSRRLARGGRPTPRSGRQMVVMMRELAGDPQIFALLAKGDPRIRRGRCQNPPIKSAKMFRARAATVPREAPSAKARQGKLYPDRCRPICAGACAVLVSVAWAKGDTEKRKPGYGNPMAAVDLRAARRGGVGRRTASGTR